MKKVKREYSAGCVVFKRGRREKKDAKKAKIKFLIGKHSGYHKWVLPKGLIEKGERAGETAVRETEEEMGVKAKIVDKKPLYKETYFYYADFKKSKESQRAVEPEERQQKPRKEKPRRRVRKYQEQGGEKTKVFKTVTFYLAEYVSGNPEKDHGWEMERAGWFDYNEALEKLAFKGERETLKKARKKIQKIEKQPSLL